MPVRTKSHGTPGFLVKTKDGQIGRTIIPDYEERKDGFCRVYLRKSAGTYSTFKMSDPVLFKPDELFVLSII